MDINSISEKKFTEVMRGYKREEVEEYLGDIAREYSKLKRENAELEKKLEVLADKIREYREDEDALKDALLVAQRQGNAILADAKEKAEGIINDANEKGEEREKQADDYVAEKNAEAEKIIADALEEKARIEAEAQKAKDDIHTEMTIQTELDKEILARTKKEAEDFRTRIIVEYSNHMEFIKSIPEMCENEFIKETTANQDTEKLRSLIASQREAQAEEAVSEDEDVKVVESFAEIPVQASEAEVVEEEVSGFTVENAFEDSDETESNTPDFLTSKPSKNKSKFEKLEFGNNTGNGKNNGKKRR